MSDYTQRILQDLIDNYRIAYAEYEKAIDKKDRARKELDEQMRYCAISKERKDLLIAVLEAGFRVEISENF